MGQRHKYDLFRSKAEQQLPVTCAHECIFATLNLRITHCEVCSQSDACHKTHLITLGIFLPGW